VGGVGVFGDWGRVLCWLWGLGGGTSGESSCARDTYVYWFKKNETSPWKKVGAGVGEQKEKETGRDLTGHRAKKV